MTGDEAIDVVDGPDQDVVGTVVDHRDLDLARPGLEAAKLLAIDACGRARTVLPDLGQPQPAAGAPCRRFPDGGCGDGAAIRNGRIGQVFRHALRFVSCGERLRYLPVWPCTDTHPQSGLYCRRDVLPPKH